METCVCPAFARKGKRMTKLTLFLIRKDEGAVTVDWVVLSAAVIGMVMVVLVPFALSTTSSTHEIAESIANVPVGYGKD